MRGSDGMQEALFTVAKLEDFVPSDHPQRGQRSTQPPQACSIIYAARRARRSRRRSVHAPCSSDGSSRCAVSVSWSSRFATTCCIAGSSDWPSTMRSEITRVGVRACSGWIRSVFPASPCRAAARSGAFWRSWRRIFRSLYAIPDSIEINALSYADIRPGSSRIDRFLSVPTPNRQRRVSVAKGSPVGGR